MVETRKDSEAKSNIERESWMVAPPSRSVFGVSNDKEQKDDEEAVEVRYSCYFTVVTDFIPKKSPPRQVSSRELNPFLRSGTGLPDEDKSKGISRLSYYTYIC